LYQKYTNAVQLLKTPILWLMCLLLISLKKELVAAKKVSEVLANSNADVATIDCEGA
jgi:hypothetical protein